MENFNMGSKNLQEKSMEHNQPTSNASDELSMSVSGICHTDSGEKYAFVSFTDGQRTAEGKIPDCKITSNSGFAEIEVASLERYMQENLSQLKKMASQVNLFKAFTQ